MAFTVMAYIVMAGVRDGYTADGHAVWRSRAVGGLHGRGEVRDPIILRAQLSRDTIVLASAQLSRDTIVLASGPIIARHFSVGLGPIILSTPPLSFSSGWGCASLFG